MVESILVLTDLALHRGFLISGNRSYDGTASSVSAAGDVNGDGIGDIIVGAPFNNSGGALSGTAFVVYGRIGAQANVNLTTLTAADGFVIIGDAANDVAGWSVSSAGDVYGDGIGDVIVGADGNDAGGDEAGAAYVVFGTTGPRGPLDLGELAPADGFAIIGGGADDAAGWSVSAAGDVNGDGLDDILVGAPGNGGLGEPGAGHVTYGRSASAGPLPLAALAPADGFSITRGAPGEQAGFSVSDAGDVNGDGLADIVVGVPGGGAGAVYVVYGKLGARDSVDLSALDSADGFAITGAAISDMAGSSVSDAGDVNGDGIADLIIGASGNDAAGSNAGAAYVVYGQSGVRNGVDLSALGTTEGFAIVGAAAADLAGFSVSGAGDINDDGIGDIIVGAPYSDLAIAEVGTAYVLYGRSGPRVTLDLSTLAVADGFALVGSEAIDSVGTAVSAAGDVNADGVDDIIVGTRYYGSGYNAVGTAYIVYGTRAGSSESAPEITSNGGGGDAAIALDEGVSAVTTVTAIDPNPGSTIAFSISGGADSARLTIDAQSGALRFMTATDHEAPADANGDDVYEVVVRASDGVLFDEQTLHIAIGDVIEGNPGVTIVGTGGNDVINPKTAPLGQPLPTDRNDILYGGAGKDRLDGGLGNDTCFGGAGDDRFIIGAIGDMVVEDADGGTDTMESAVADLVLAAQVEKGLLKDVKGVGADLDITGNSAANDLTGNSGANRIAGGGGADWLSGKAGDDMLLGDEGDDLLNGGAGADMLTGGAGADLFKFDKFSLGGSIDSILDFTRAQGDRISLSAIDANGSAGGNGKFLFLGTAAFSGARGELRYENPGGSTMLTADTDGDGLANLILSVSGVVSFAASDFLL